ncbi:glycine betaine ABC transporter substrate-binding protein [Streptacidiphilus pinicola]|uniref:glycine betaine ABC transporter substrate-binding protein n=1 Tax=Streptacidiphilus pinicola TaxID=2219663 RepID=UPI001A9E2DCE|nr:glycine betaine ABC transporter substrate-binding protein [Streptacidiphilus pinicola]
MKKALTSALVAACATVLAACGSSGSSGSNGLSGGSSASAGGGATVASKLVLGGSPEFKTRTDGVPGLQRVYGVTFGSYKTLDAGGPLTINALKNGQIDAGDIFTTDPSIPANGFVVLQDPKNLYAAQNVLPLINKAKATPGVSSTLNAVSAKLDTNTLAQLDVHVITDKQDPDAVAKGWLASVGLNKTGTAAQGASIKIGSANFQESVLLAEIYAEALRAQGANITTRLNIGSRETYIPGLKDGSIDLIPEYSGVLLQFFDPKATAVSSADVYAALQKAVPAPLTVLDQSSAEDKDAIVVTKTTADKYHLTSIADLAKNG